MYGPMACSRCQTPCLTSLFAILGLNATSRALQKKKASQLPRPKVRRMPGIHCDVVALSGPLRMKHGAASGHKPSASYRRVLLQPLAVPIVVAASLVAVSEDGVHG